MKQIMMILLCGAALAAGASAQVYSQPVRDVEKEARSAVRGNCEISVDPGYVSTLTDCALSDLNQILGSTVPAGKVLVIEDISASCAKSNADLTMTLAFRTGGNFWKHLPLQLVRTLSNGRQAWIASVAARMYAKAGENVWIAIDTGNNASQLTSCGVRFQGHLVNAN